MNSSEDQSAGLASSVDWDQIADCVERFLEAWEANGYGPPLFEFAQADSAVQRRAILIELIKVDLEFRYSSGGPILKLEDYLAENPELGQPDGIPAELVFEEFHARSGTGEQPTVQEYLDRFPEQRDQILAVLPLEHTTTMTPSGESVADQFRPGDRVADFYLMSSLGTGAFGSVFLARQESMQRMVALKISGDKGSEGQTLAQLDHPNIVRVHDQTVLPDENLRLLYMQFAAGGTLQKVIKESKWVKTKTGRLVAECIAEAVDRTGVLSSASIPLKGGYADRTWVEVTCQLGMELAQALQYAHERSILHRDIKPANVLLEADGSAKLADFNISFGTDVEGDSAASNFGGSLAYMSPEQIDAFDPRHPTTPEDLDERADIYSLGVLLWELFFGTRPFDDDAKADSISATLDHLRQQRCASLPGPPESFAGEPAERQLMTILHRCLQPHREHRYGNAFELARDLGLCLQPRVARLMHQSRTGWRAIAGAWPIVAVVLAAVTPHVPAAVFNYAYNERSIVEQLPDNSKEVFVRAVVVINALAFGIGIGCCIWYTLPIRRFLRNGRSSSSETQIVRQRMFGLSRFVTVVGISEWIIAGMAYPIILHFLTTDGLHVRWQAHFFVSLLICGLVAAAYPFFLTSALSVRAFLPRLLNRETLTAGDLQQLAEVSDRSGWSLYLAGGVPAIGIMILIFTQEAADSAFPLQVFSVVGAVGFAFALSLSRRLQANIEAIIDCSRRWTGHSAERLRAED